MLNRVCVLFAFIFLNIFNLFAQEDKLESIKKITISEGLAHNGVTSILADDKGFLWIVTYEGINKYDGYKVTTFKNTIDKSILTNNRVREIKEDDAKNLWIGTDEGITIYNTSQEKFIKIYSNSLSGKDISGPIIRKILLNKKNKLIYCATEKEGVLVFNQDYKLVHKFYPKEINKKSCIFFDSLELENGNILFTTSTGIFIFSIKTNTFSKVLSNEVDFSKSILRVKENLYIISLKYGVLVACLDTKKEKFYNTKVILKEDQFNSANIDKKGSLWLGTLDKGVTVINDVYKVLNCTKIEPFTLRFFTDNSDRLRISTIVASKDNVWLGTFNKGLFQFTTKENPFKKYDKKMNYSYEIKSNSVSSISALDKDRFYVTATFGGLSLFNSKTQKFEPLPFDIPENYKLDIAGVFVDSKKDTWLKINGLGGVFKIKYGQRKYKVIKHQFHNVLRFQNCHNLQ